MLCARYACMSDLNRKRSEAMSAGRLTRSLLCALTLVLAAPVSAAPATACNRQCLSGTMQAYLAALTANDPSKAPLSGAFRQTENAVAIPLGDGLWKNAKALGSLQRRYFDPVTSTAAYFGTLAMASGETGANGETGIVSLRLHVSDGKVDEAEWHLARPSDQGITAGAKAMYDLKPLLAGPPPERVVAPRDRIPRETLIAITNSYFDGITAENAKLIRAHPGCKRLENGMGAPPSARSDDGKGPPDCMSGQGQFGVAFVAGRRFPLVDEEAQVVLAIGAFIRKPGNPKFRNQFTEFFYIDQEKIREIYAAYFFAKPDQPLPNWPPYAGNFPLAPEPAAPAQAK
jgi:hypothetical protein